MIAQTIMWVVLTQDFWNRATEKVLTNCRIQPYQSIDSPFCGRCVAVVATLGM